MAHLRTQTFGSTRAPGNWARVTRLAQWILLTYFGIYLPIFADDCFMAELTETIPIAYSCGDDVVRLCGFELDKAKTQTRNIALLGSSVASKRDSICASLPVP